ncbi:MAG: MFS transporter [Gemmatimonadaceae bacterium]|nr:MFS transporter [Gemmatimonadaceae bacterium]
MLRHSGGPANWLLVFTFVGLGLIDRLGRRTLLTIGSFGYIASLGLCAWAFFTFFPAMVTAFAPGYVFLFFCGMMVLQLIWVKTMVPETKGVPLEGIQRQLGVAA